MTEIKIELTAKVDDDIDSLEEALAEAEGGIYIDGHRVQKLKGEHNFSIERLDKEAIFLDALEIAVNEFVSDDSKLRSYDVFKKLERQNPQVARVENRSKLKGWLKSEFEGFEHIETDERGHQPKWFYLDDIEVDRVRAYLYRHGRDIRIEKQVKHNLKQDLVPAMIDLFNALPDEQMAPLTLLETMARQTEHSLDHLEEHKDTVIEIAEVCGAQVIGNNIQTPDKVE